MKTSSRLAVGFLVFVVACAPSVQEGPEPPSDAVVVGLTSDIGSWNPYLAEDAKDEEILGLVFPQLAVEQPDYHLGPPTFEPSLARSWEWSQDGLELTVYLRTDAVWSDGTPVTSADIEFSWQVQTSEELGWAWGDITDSITAVTAVDAHTVRYEFTHRYPYQLMDVNDGPIVPAHAWRSVPLDQWEDTDWLPLVVSAGPYTPVEHTPQQEIVLQRNATYFEAGRPKIQRVVFRVVPSTPQVVSQLLAGSVDLVNGVPHTDADRVRTSPDVDLTLYADRSFTHVCWKLDHPVLDDPTVRLALAHAVDRNALIDVVYNGFATPSLGPVLSSMWAFNREIEAVPYDPDAARSLLAEAGWQDTDGDGVLDRNGTDFEFELMAPSESSTRQDVVLMIERDLGRIGVKVIPRFVEFGTMLAAMDNGEFDAFVNRSVEPTQVDLRSVWHSAQPGEPTFNHGGYANPEVDRLLDEVDAAHDFTTQKPLLDRIQMLIVNDQPFLFLVENTRLVGHRSRIKGADINAASVFFNLDEWELAPSEH